MADLIGVDFWVIEESDMDMHPFTVFAGSVHLSSMRLSAITIW